MIFPTQLFKDLAKISPTMIFDFRETQKGKLVVGAVDSSNVLACCVEFKVYFDEQDSICRYKIAPLDRLATPTVQCVVGKSLMFRAAGMSIYKIQDTDNISNLPVGMDVSAYTNMEFPVSDLYGITEMIAAVSSCMFMETKNKMLKITDSDIKEHVTKSIALAKSSREKVCVNPDIMLEVLDIVPKHRDMTVTLGIKTGGAITVSYDNYTFYIAPKELKGSDISVED